MPKATRLTVARVRSPGGCPPLKTTPCDFADVRHRRRDDTVLSGNDSPPLRWLSEPARRSRAPRRENTGASPRLVRLQLLRAKTLLCELSEVRLRPHLPPARRRTASSWPGSVVREGRDLSQRLRTAPLCRGPVHLRSLPATVEMEEKRPGLPGATPAPLGAPVTHVRHRNRQADFRSPAVTKGAPFPPRPFPGRVSPRQADPDASPGPPSVITHTAVHRAATSCPTPRGRRSPGRPPTHWSLNGSLQSPCGRRGRATGEGSPPPRPPGP